jgi:ABC-type antimicrobial peptide transport system permease subunit
MATRGQPTEPEIIPPGKEPTDWRRSSTDPWAQHNVYGTQRIFVGRIGPIGFLLIAVLLGLVAAFVFVTVVGALFFLIPIAALLLVGAIIGSLMRRRLRR